MRAKSIPAAKQYELILECRNSGLTDYQWCKEHNIHPGTFYNWVSKLKKRGINDIPNPGSYKVPLSVKQEVVKLDVINAKPSVLPASSYHEFTKISNIKPTIEISLGTTSIKISNDVSPLLLQSLIEVLGGLKC